MENDPEKNFEPCDENNVPPPDSAPDLRTCTLCGRSYEPLKKNQAYCTPKCRRRSLTVRTKAAKLAQIVTLQPPLALSVAVRQLNRSRRASSLLPAQRDAYLQAHAELVEAQQQLQRWQRLAVERGERLTQLQQPTIRAQLLIVRPGDTVQLDPRATHYAAAATDSGLGVLALGFATG